MTLMCVYVFGSVCVFVVMCWTLLWEQETETDSVTGYRCVLCKYNMEEILIHSQGRSRHS